MVFKIKLYFNVKSRVGLKVAIFCLSLQKMYANIYMKEKSIFKVIIYNFTKSDL